LEKKKKPIKKRPKPHLLLLLQQKDCKELARENGSVPSATPKRSLFSPAIPSQVRIVAAILNCDT